MEFSPKPIPGIKPSQVLQHRRRRRQNGKVLSISSRHNLSGLYPNAVCYLYMATLPENQTPLTCSEEACVEAHRIDFRRHPMVKVDRPRQVAKKILQIKEGAKVQFFSHNRLAFEFDSLP